MRDYKEYKRIIELWEQGHNKLQISRMTGIPRPTVRDVIKRYGSLGGLENHTDPYNYLNPKHQETFRHILKLWEEGKSKVEIAAITGLSRYRVTTCIEQYRTLARFEGILQGGPLPDMPVKEHSLRQHRPRPRRYTDEELAEAVERSASIAQTLRLLGVRPAGGNYATVKRRIQQLELDTSHFTGQGWLRGQRKAVTSRRPMSEILVKDSTYRNSSHLKRRLITEGYLQARCGVCGLDEWMGQSIPLEVHHVNGDKRDNRIENLRLLCPNCHALTPTYRGKNISLNGDSPN